MRMRSTLFGTAMVLLLGAPFAVQAQVLLFDNINQGACGFTDTAVFQLRADSQIDRLALWYNWSAGEQSLPYTLAMPGQTMRSGTMVRGGCDPYQGSWCLAEDHVNAQFPAGQYTIRAARARVCQNSGSGGRGFVQAYGRIGGGSEISGGGVCTPVGTWDWVDNATVVIRADGTAAGGPRDGSLSSNGRWEGLGGNRYRLTWPLDGLVDTLTLSADGRSWDGTNNVGRSFHVSCRTGSSNYAAVPMGEAALIGSWKRTDGDELYTFTADGGATGVNRATRFVGRWTRTGTNKYTITWPDYHPPGQNQNYVDTLTVSADGNSFSGVNNYGDPVRAVKQRR